MLSFDVLRDSNWWWWREVWTRRTTSVMRLSNERGRRRGRCLLAWLGAAYERSEDIFHISVDSSRCDSLKMNHFGQIQNHVMIYVSKAAKCITGICSTVYLIWHWRSNRGTLWIQIQRLKDAVCLHILIYSRYYVSKLQSDQGHILIQFSDFDSTFWRSWLRLKAVSRDEEDLDK